ncbi:MAG: hypothetical protein JSR70_00640 [Proteobacteria bacterium]|nr:hypothetical protein [Pseudomonadota bacterium]
MTIYYGSKHLAEAWDCIVKMTPEEILVEYQDNGLVQYIGNNDGSGHVSLVATGVDGKATLHMFPGSEILEGTWVEDGERGMWRIELNR